MKCSRCGSEGHTEYAPDGQAYCSACLFYGLNKPCWKCRMYLPSTELQQYLGQWTCPYCIMDLKDAEKKEKEPEYAAPAGTSGEKDMLKENKEDELCDRCKRRLAIVYIFNNRKLCELCINKEKKEFEETKGSGATPMIVKFRLKGNESLLSRILRKLEIAVSGIFEKKKESKPEPKKEKKDEKKNDKDDKPEFEKHFKD